jgi:hypothetical protein
VESGTISVYLKNSNIGIYKLLILKLPFCSNSIHRDIYNRDSKLYCCSMFDAINRDVRALSG